MTVNQFMRRVKYDVMLSSLDIPLTVNGKEVTDIEFVFGEHNEDGSYKDISIDIKTEYYESACNSNGRDCRG